MSSRQIAHLDMDTFFVSAERLRDNALEGRPVLIGGYSDRAVVASCSYEARRFGIHSGMPMKMALRLCPQAIIRKSDIDYYARKSKEVTEIITERAPVVEKPSIDEHYLDLTGFDRYFGCRQFTHELRVRIKKESGLNVSFGLSKNKTVSKIATNKAKPNGELEVDLGAEKTFMAPLPVKAIPGVGMETAKELGFLGATRIHDIQEMDVSHMQHALGENGVSIWNKANALDDTPVVPYREQKSISKERTFSTDTTDPAFLKKTLAGMVGELAFELRDTNRLAACITVKVRYSDWDNKSLQMRIPHTSLDDVLLARTLELFNKVNSRRQLIRLVGVKFSQFVSGSHQIHLFDDTQEHIALYQALDGIRKRFGAQAVIKALSL